MEIPIYQSQIAPPASTGRSAASEISKAQFLQGQVQQRAEKAKQVGDTIGGILQPMLEQRETMNNEAALNEALDAYKQDAAQLGYLLETERATMGSWGPDASGNRGANMESWHTGRQERYGEGLTGDYLNRFNQMTDEIARGMDQSIMENDLKFARESKAASDSRAMNDAINNPDTIDPRAYTDRMVQENDARIDEGILNRTYSPIQGEEAKQAFRQNLETATYGAIAIDIQDGDGWTDVATGKYYNGYNGALEMIEDMSNEVVNEETGEMRLNATQAQALIRQVDEHYSLKGSRGNSVQQQKSIDYINEYSQAIAEGQRFTADQIYSDPRINFEETDVYRRNGDRSAANMIMNMQEQADRALASGDDLPFLDPEVEKRWKDQTINQDEFIEWFSANGEKYYPNPDDRVKIMKWSKPVFDNATRSYAISVIDDQYKVQLADAQKKGDQELISSIVAQKNEDLSAILRTIVDSDIKTAEDVDAVWTNYLTGKLEYEIYKDYTKEDRTLNPAESLNYILQQGGGRGLSEISRFRKQFTEAGELQKQIVSGVYGEDAIRDIRWGDQGTMYEGRVCFLVDDFSDMNPDGTPKQKWIRLDTVVSKFDEDGTPIRGEEQIMEFVPGEYDPSVGEQWNAATAPILQTELAAAQAQATAGAFEEAFAEQAPPVAPRTEVTPTPTGPRDTSTLPTAQQWYLHNSNGTKISLRSTQQYIASENMADGEIRDLYNFIYDTALPDLSRDLENQERAGSIDLFRANGALKWGAKRAIEKISEGYGVPPAYTDRILLDVFGVED